MIPRTFASLLLALAVTSPLTANAQSLMDAPPLEGRVEGRMYHSPRGSYSVQIPVLAELGGTIVDTETVVTFQDSLSVHASIACFAMDATQRWENETRGRKDYLIWFFTHFVQLDFQQRFPGSQAQPNAKFLPTVQDGALLTYNLLPGGSMFADRLILTSGEEQPVAKRGNLLFVKNENIYILSIELAERVLDRTTWDKTTEQEDEVLRKRLLDLLGKMQFPEPPAKP